MNDGGSGNWRAWLAGGVFLAVIVAAFLILRESEPRPIADEPEAAPVHDPVLPAAPPPLSRAELIDAAARVADAAAAGRTPPAEYRALTGRRFTLQLPFGCEGPASEEASADASWSYDRERETLRASVRPQVWTDAAFIRSAVGSTPFEAAEGFWISRPWMRTPACPARPAAAAATTDPTSEAGREGESEEAPADPADSRAQREGAAIAPETPETLALVELFGEGTRRSARRNGRPYSVVAQVTAAEIDLERGLRLLVQGRLATLGDGQPIACRPEGPQRPPRCVIGARIERVAITDATGERVLGEWTN